MKVLARAKNRELRITGHPNSGWKLADVGDSEATRVSFQFFAIEDGAGGVSLCFESLDRHYAADYNYSNLASAISAANQLFGILPSEWAS